MTQALIVICSEEQIQRDLGVLDEARFLALPNNSLDLR